MGFLSECERTDFWTLFSRIYSATEGNETEMCKCKHAQLSRRCSLRRINEEVHVRRGSMLCLRRSHGVTSAMTQPLRPCFHK